MMSVSLNVTELEQAGAMIKAGGPAAFYSFMAHQGYNYALFAGSLVSGSGFDGAAAINYLFSSAKAQGVLLAQSEVPVLESKLATAWVVALERVARVNPDGEVGADLGYQQTLDFHMEVFSEYGLSKEAWMLTVPGEILGIPFMEANFASLLSELSTASGNESIRSVALLLLAMSGAAIDGKGLSAQQIVTARQWLTTNAFNIGRDLETIERASVLSGHGTMNLSPKGESLAEPSNLGKGSEAGGLPAAV
jgi:hypothetical protein